jgi:hypothetical protein
MAGIEDAFAAATGSKLVDESQPQTEQQVDNQEAQPEQQPEQIVESNEQSSLNNENNISEQVESNNIADEDLLNAFNEKFDTNYSSFDDFSKVQEQDEKPQFASEELQRLNDFVSNTGRSVYDFYQAYNVDYDKVSDAEIMRSSLKRSNPELSDEELNIYFNSTYKTGSDKYNDDEKALGNINLKKDASKARAELKELQESIKKPSENYVSPEREQEIRDNFLDNLDDEVEDLEGISFDLDDKGTEFTYKLTEQDRDSLYDNNSNLDNFFDRYIDNETGQWNMEKLNMEMFILNNFDKIVRGVASQTKSSGREDIIKDIKNPSFTPQQKTTERGSKSIWDQIEDEMFKK